MHSMHSLATQDQMSRHHQDDMREQNGSNTITVLESLDPSQQQQQQQQQQHAVSEQQIPANQQIASHVMNPAQQQVHLVQHLVQQPLLHQLQPSHAPSAVAAVSATHMDMSEEQSARASQSNSNTQSNTSSGHLANNNNNLLRPRAQIEGIVADGGGPIVQWLLDNYEIADGESLPRSTVYNHYLAHCRHLQMASVNAASFGKLIRSVFIGLKTRRLGTRGHSKYHYFGVRAKQHIQHELMQHHINSGHDHSSTMGENCNSNQNGTDNGSESDSTGGRLSANSPGKRPKRSTSSVSATNRGVQLYSSLAGHHEPQHPTHMDSTAGYYSTAQADQVEEEARSHHHINGSGTTPNNGADDAISLEHQNHCELSDFRHYLGANWSTLVDELWPRREPCALERHLIKSTGLNELGEALQVFEYNYKVAYKRMLELLSELKFFDIEHLWLEFWHPQSSCQQQGAGWPSNGEQQLEQLHQLNGRTNSCHHHQELGYQQASGNIELGFSQLYQLTSQPAVVEWITQIDYALYAAIESFLLPDMLNPIPRLLAQQIRLFAKHFKTWIEMAVKDYESNFVSQKMESAGSFCILLRHYTSLNNLSSASRAVWDKRSSLAQMSMDLSRVDLRDIEHQVSLMSNSQQATHNHLQTSGVAEHTNEQQRVIGRDLLGRPELQSIQGHCDGAETNTVDSNSTMLLGPIRNTDNDKSDKNIINRQDRDTTNQHLGSAQHHHHHHHPHLCATMQPGQLIQNFLHLLEDPYPANSWPDWCRNLVESRVCGLSIEEARNFVLKWNFYISLIMKELTLRSAPSFGSFYLIRLLFDEYIFYLVVTRLAQAQHKTPAQLLSLWLKLCRNS